MFIYLSSYNILVCRVHQYAIYNVEEHLKRHHSLPIQKRRELLASYSHLALLPPSQVSMPALSSAPFAELRRPQDAWLCCYCYSSSTEPASQFISTSRSWMQKHLNQQHSIKLSRWSTPSAASYAEHAAQLWKPVKVQTFFQERRYVRYFTVQEQQQQEQSQPMTAEQQEAESSKQRQAALLHEWETVAGKDRDAIEQIAEEASTKDRTG
jgi:hypothetical protein